TMAAPLGNLPALAVPNTLLDPTAHDFGKVFDVTALAVDGTLSTPTEEDYYSFHGARGQVMNIQVISINNTRNPNPIISELLLVSPSGQVIGYNVHTFESPDATLLDITLPEDGTYYVGVDSYQGQTAGDYQLFMDSFAARAGDPAAVATGD